MSDKKTLEEILDYLLWGTSRMIEIDLEKTKRKAKQAITQHLLDVVERAINDCDDGCNHKDTHKGHSPEWWGAYKLGQNQFQQNIIRELKK